MRRVLNFELYKNCGCIETTKNKLNPINFDATCRTSLTRPPPRSPPFGSFFSHPFLCLGGWGSPSQEARQQFRYLWHVILNIHLGLHFFHFLFSVGILHHFGKHGDQQQRQHHHHHHGVEQDISDLPLLPLLEVSEFSLWFHFDWIWKCCHLVWLQQVIFPGSVFAFRIDIHPHRLVGIVRVLNFNQVCTRGETLKNEGVVLLEESSSLSPI